MNAHGTWGVVTTSFPRDAGDPAGRFVLTHLKARRPRAATHVIAVGKVAGEQAAVDGFRVTRVASRGIFDAEGAPEVWDRTRGLPLQSLRLEAGRVTASLIEAIAKFSPNWQAVESHWLVPCAVAVAAAAPGLFHAAHAHSGDVAWLEKAPGGASLARWLVARVNEVVCVTEALAMRLQRLVGRWPRGVPLLVRAMPADADVFKPAQTLEQRRGVLAVGRLVPIKGFDRLLFALAGLPSSERPPLLVLGEGPERARLEGLASRLGVHMSLPGTVPPAEVASRLAEATVFVLPSGVLPGGRAEGAPLALREALAMGTPVVSTVASPNPVGCPEVLLVPPNDVAALRAALSKALRSTRDKSA